MDKLKPTPEMMALMKAGFSAEEQAKMTANVKRWKKIGLSTEKTDIKRALAAMKILYAAADVEFPAEYLLFDSPKEAKVKMKELYGMDVTSNNFLYGSFDASFLSTYDYFLENTDALASSTEGTFAKAMVELAKCCGWCLVFDELVVFTHRPKVLKFDENDKPHCEDGMAIEYRDGFGTAMWHGVGIPKEWVLNKSSITPEVIANCENEEQARAAREIIA